MSFFGSHAEEATCQSPAQCSTPLASEKGAPGLSLLSVKSLVSKRLSDNTITDDDDNDDNDDNNNNNNNNNDDNDDNNNNNEGNNDNDDNDGNNDDDNNNNNNNNNNNDGSDNNEDNNNDAADEGEDNDNEEGEDEEDEDNDEEEDEEEEEGQEEEGEEEEGEEEETENEEGEEDDGEEEGEEDDGEEEEGEEEDGEEEEEEETLGEEDEEDQGEEEGEEGKDGEDGVPTKPAATKVSTAKSKRCIGASLKLKRGSGEGDVWRCKGGYCVPKENRCNGWINCGDGTDEQDCPAGSPKPSMSPTGKSKKCSAPFFPGGMKLKRGAGDDKTWRCKGGWCVTKELRCNGKKNCGDGSDEVGC